MKVRWLILILVVASGLLGAAGSSSAATIPLRVDVFVDEGSGFAFKGTAIAGTGVQGFVVLGNGPGDTVRFLVGLAAPTSTNITSYTTTVTTDDPGEIDYVLGSGVNLLGINFAALANPDDQFTDATPGTGFINSTAGNAAGTDFYRVDYIINSLNTGNSFIDFSVGGVISTVGGTDLAASSIVEITLSGPMPEPASLLFLASGLAGLAGHLRQRRRRRAD